MSDQIVYFVLVDGRAWFWEDNVQAADKLKEDIEKYIKPGIEVEVKVRV